MSDRAAAAGGITVMTPLYRNYVLFILFLAYTVNIIDRAILSLLLEPIKAEFVLSDTELGLLGGFAFAIAYSVLGLPLGAWADRWIRKNVLAICIAGWSIATALCGTAIGFKTLILARIGTASGEAGCSPAAHSLIADYFKLEKRATALSFFALGIPAGTFLGNLIGGFGNDAFGWRWTFVLGGAPGVLVALLVWFTVKEPQRGLSDEKPHNTDEPAPTIGETIGFLARKRAFVHLTLAAAMHSVAWYSGSVWNAPFLQRSHDLTSSQTGGILGTVALIAALGTFFGGVLSDRLSKWRNDRRWYMWLPGLGCLLMIPFQFISYLGGDLGYVVPSFAVMLILGSLFFGPSFAMTQGLAAPRMRAIAASILLFMQTIIGLTVGPWLVGLVSDYLMPSLGIDSLRWSLVLVQLWNIWAAAHYWFGSKHLRQELEATESLSEAARTPG